MTDDLDHVRALFRAEAEPETGEAAKAAGIAAAMVRYDEILSRRSQGKATALRLIRQARGLLPWSNKMHGLKLSHGLMAGASFAVIAVIAVNSGLLREAQNIPIAIGP